MSAHGSGSESVRGPIARAELVDRVRRAAQPLRVWSVLESDPCAPPFDRPRVRVAAAFLDAEDAACWRFEAHTRRPWLDHEVRATGLADSARGLELAWPTQADGEEVIAALERGPEPPPLDRAIAARRCAWRSPTWPSSVLESAVSIDAIDDELVWWGLRHEKGDHELEIRQPIPAFLESPWISREAPPGLRAEIVRAIAEHRAPGADRDPSLAARRGALQRLELLLEVERLPLEHRDAAGRTPLAAALSSSHQAVALYLLRAGASLAAAIEHTHGAPEGGAARPHARVLALGLDVALRRRWFELAAELVARGAPVDEPLGARAWELALLGGAPAGLIAAMIARGARLEPASGVWTSYRFVQHAWRSEALAALSPVPLPPRPAPTHIAPRTARRPAPPARVSSAESAARERARALWSAVAAGDLAAIETEIGAAAREGWDGQLALHHVSRAPAEKQAAIVARLLAAGAAVDAPDRSGATALAKAVRRGALDAVRALLDAGASPSTLDEGRSLVAHAVLADAPAVLELLLAAGASGAERGGPGTTALGLALTKRRTACLEILQRHARARG